MKNNESLQQVRPPFTMALTAIFASLLASMTSADHPGSPLILIPLLMILPWVTWNHPPSLATSGAMLLTVSILAPYNSDGPNDLYLALQDSMVLRRPASGSGARSHYRRAHTLVAPAHTWVAIHPSSCTARRSSNWNHHRSRPF